MSKEHVEKRPAHTLQVLGLAICSIPFLFLPKFLTEELQRSSCSKLTFKLGQTDPNAFLPFAIIMLVLSMAVFSLYAGLKLGSAETTSLAPETLLISSIAGYICGVMLILAGAGSYFCLSPDEITLRSGWFEPSITSSWTDLVAVRARCWIEHPGRGPAYHGATLDLYLKDARIIQFEIWNDHQILSEDYRRLKGALKPLDYQFVVTSSVSPENCPQGVEPLFRNWSDH